MKILELWNSLSVGVGARVFSLFFYLLCLHSVGIFLFTRGFLLTRTELPLFSSCSDVFDSPCLSADPMDDKGRKCWTKSAIQRAIIIIIDALRFDFVAHSSNFPGEPEAWMDKLPVLQRLARENRNSARIFKFVADPPTTTLQRLKGLTTGGLPTFVDIGHSFGAPAIVEDNLILQLVRRGKKVRMMGDDTWMQLFPSHFSEAHPFPSFNVKDLHTVDDGVIREIYPALLQSDWSLLIAHFLGVDHVGHIFGVESPLMVEKLEQYNRVIEEVVAVLEKESGPGGLHEGTMLLVMGDHGQTLHGDHGGGTSEEVETALFAMAMQNPPGSLPSNFRAFPCNMAEEEQKPCISTLPQLDFSATMAALLGVAIPFGSVGRVNPELYALAAGTWLSINTSHADEGHDSHTVDWLSAYKDVLCINSWQVKRYLEAYSTSSIGGFPAADFAHVQSLYATVQSLASKPLHQDPSQLTYLDHQFDTLAELDAKKREELVSKVTGLTKLVYGYLNYLESAADLARAQWTQFGDGWMVLGLSLLVASIVVHAVALSRAMVLPMERKCRRPTVKFYFALLFVGIHAGSLLSNSYIMGEGQVVCFLLASSGILYLRTSLQGGSNVPKAILFLILNGGMTSIGLVEIFKDPATSGQHNLRNNHFPASYSPTMLISLSATAFATTMLPLSSLAWLIIRRARKVYMYSHSLWWAVTFGVPLAYFLLALHWFTMDLAASVVIVIPQMFKEFARLLCPRLVYSISLGLVGLTASLISTNSTKRGVSVPFGGLLVEAILIVFSGLSGTIILLLGRKGPTIALLAVLEVWCLLDLQGLGSLGPKCPDMDKVASERKLEVNGGVHSESHFAATVDWNLVAVQLFFCTGHRCTFDGLHYTAAFIGFDDFYFYRQGALLAADTFGASHILPVIGLPLLITGAAGMSRKMYSMSDTGYVSLEIAKAYISYGLVRAILATVTTACVALQRRHLMVWGLFAPKYVFDALGLLVIDIFVVIAVLFYFSLRPRTREDLRQ
ncbi:unnamed protein product [Sphagnum balticum]